MESEEPGDAAPAALPVVVHVSEDDPSLALAVIDWRNGDRAARARVVSNLGGRLTAVVEHVSPGRPPEVAGVAVRRALGEPAEPSAGALPIGPAPTATSAEWNRRPVAVAASLALWHLARLLGAEPTRFEGPAADLDVAEQSVLRLLDVDLATWSQVGELWGCNPNDVVEVHRTARSRLGMDDPSRALCPSWPAVRTSHLATASERSAVKWHVLECQACTQAISETAARRTKLLRLLPPRVARGTLLPGVGSALPAFLEVPPIDQLLPTDSDDD